MSDTLELFSARVCPFAHRSRLVLMEKGLEFTLTEVDLSNKSDRFMQVSAYGKVPALVHGAVQIYESAIINEYIDEVFPEPPLLPGSPAGRAAARIWIDYCNHHFVDDYYALIRSADSEKQSEHRKRVEDQLRFVEHHALANGGDAGPYWFGAAPTLVDFAWYPHCERLPAWTHYRGVKIPPECSRLLGWINAMRERDSVQSIANSSDYYIERYKHYATG